MAIEYLEIRNTNREIIGILDTAKSIIWHSVWFGVGDFEVYAQATAQNLTFLKVGHYITRGDNEDIGIIEDIDIFDSVTDGRMITATGRFAKSILDRRLIYNLSGTGAKLTNKATVLRGSVESAARALVANNAISCTFDTTRNFTILELGTLHGYTPIIVDESGNAADKQVSYQNLLEYSDGLLEEYGLSAVIRLDDNTKKLQYEVLQGADRSASNTAGNEQIIFSKDFDNLSDSEYRYNIRPLKNVALIGGAGEGLDRFYSIVKPSGITGLNRREVFVDAASLSVKYKDEQEQEQTYSDAEYANMLKTQGKQSLAALITEESFTGTILANYGEYVLNRDFWLGDIITVQENSIDKYIDVRITETTEVQDENGYTVEAVYK